MEEWKRWNWKGKYPTWKDGKGGNLKGKHYIWTDRKGGNWKCKHHTRKNRKDGIGKVSTIHARMERWNWRGSCKDNTCKD